MNFRYKTRRFAHSMLARVFPVALAKRDERRHQDTTRRAEEIGRLLAQRFASTVQAGPFAGMRYIDEARHSGFCPKLVGCYEAEIMSCIELAVASPYDLFIDVGCAEGYYAVGLPYAVQRRTGVPGQTRTVAYDIDDSSRSLCRKLADLNGVSDRVDIRSDCDHAALCGLANELKASGDSRVLLLCDCEGYEQALLDPARVPSLRFWDVLVELHEMVVPDVAQIIQDRFAPTHDIRAISSHPYRDPAPFRGVDFLPSLRDRRLAVSDLRGTPQQWLWMTSTVKKTQA